MATGSGSLRVAPVIYFPLEMTNGSVPSPSSSLLGAGEMPLTCQAQVWAHRGGCWAVRPVSPHQRLPASRRHSPPPRQRPRARRGVHKSLPSGSPVRREPRDGGGGRAGAAVSAGRRGAAVGAQRSRDALLAGTVAGAGRGAAGARGGATRSGQRLHAEPAGCHRRRPAAPRRPQQAEPPRGARPWAHPRRERGSADADDLLHGAGRAGVPVPAGLGAGTRLRLPSGVLCLRLAPGLFVWLSQAGAQTEG